MSTPPPQKPVYSQPAPAFHGAPAVTCGEATTSMVMGIIALFMCGIIFGPIAIVMGNKAKRKIQANPGMQGDGAATAGLVCGWIATILNILGIVIMIVYFVVVFLVVAGGIAAVGTAAYHISQDAMATYSPLFEANNQLVEQHSGFDLPTHEEGNRIIEGFLDRYGTQIEYRPDGSEYTLVSAGADRQMDTIDDATIGPFFNLVDRDVSESEYVREEAIPGEEVPEAMPELEFP